MTPTQHIEHIEDSARRVIGSIANLTLSNDPQIVRELIDRHRPHLVEFRHKIANATPISTSTRETLDRLDAIIAQVIDELDATRDRLDAHKWGTDSIGIVAGITNDLGVLISIAIATILAQITK